MSASIVHIVLLYRVEYAREVTPEDVAIVLVGNKSDMISERAVSKEDCLRKAQSMGTKYMETSTKDNTNIKETFELLLESMLANGKEETSPSDSTIVTMVESENSDDGTRQHNYCGKC